MQVIGYFQSVPLQHIREYIAELTYKMGTLNGIFVKISRAVFSRMERKSGMS